MAILFSKSENTSKDSIHMCNQRSMQQIYRARAQDKKKGVIWVRRKAGNTINYEGVTLQYYHHS